MALSFVRRDTLTLVNYVEPIWDPHINNQLFPPLSLSLPSPLFPILTMLGGRPRATWIGEAAGIWRTRKKKDGRPQAAWIGVAGAVI